jgi:hypothetical protein
MCGMDAELSYQQILALVLDELKRLPRDQYAALNEAVVRSAARKGLIADPGDGRRGPGYRASTDRIHEFVHQALWECIVKGVVVPGMDRSNPNWPFYRVTERGQRMIEHGSPQPYDRDGFVEYFRKKVPNSDPIVDGYFTEAVEAFNAGCLRASAVMLGVASEQLVLLLVEAFRASISDGGKKAKFEKELERAWQINIRYRALKERLDLMVDGKRLPAEHAEAIASEVGGVYELIRRYRNASGHPNVPSAIDADTVFLNLRTFIEYARRTIGLIDHFKTNAADW